MAFDPFRKQTERTSKPNDTVKFEEAITQSDTEAEFIPNNSSLNSSGTFQAKDKIVYDESF